MASVSEKQRQDALPAPAQITAQDAPAKKGGVDYSKFDSIVDSDDEKPAKSSKDADTKAPTPEKPVCHNCMKDIAKPLRCGICKKVSYCSQQCQKSDWSFHKRNCKKPEEPKPKASAEEKQAKKQVKEENKKREEDEKIVEGEGVKDWYKHREWKPTAEPKQEFKPTQISAEAAAAVNSSAATVAGSVWNAAGTWEEKDVTSLAQSTLHERLKEAGLPDIDAAGGAISVEEVEKVEGDASKPVIRGKIRHIFDLSFKVKFVFKWMDASGQQKASGSLSISDFTNDAFGEDCANPPVMELSFNASRQGLDAYRHKAVEDAIGASSWPAAAGTLAAALAARMRSWADEYMEVQEAAKKVQPEASREKVAEMRDHLKKARTESDREKMMSLLRELSGMKVSLESMTGTRLGVELKSCSEFGGDESKKVCDEILVKFLNKCEI